MKTSRQTSRDSQEVRSHYFNKCRLVEDIEEENKLAFQDPETSPKQKIPEIKVQDPKEDEEQEPLEIGDEVYQPEQVKKILTHILTTVRLGETKVPILGTYQNTTSGADIVEYLQKYMGATSVSHAERIGQDLIAHGFLRLIGNVGNIFANSSKMFYQWKPKAFQLSGVPGKKQILNRTISMPSNTEFSVDSPVGAVSEYLAGWNPLNTQYPNETPRDRLKREAAEADEKYKAGVRSLTTLRCQLEEAMVEHMRYLERCELDRLKAIKTIILDFSGTISNVIPSLQSTVDKMMLYQETGNPLEIFDIFSRTTAPEVSLQRSQSTKITTIQWTSRLSVSISKCEHVLTENGCRLLSPLSSHSWTIAIQILRGMKLEGAYGLLKFHFTKPTDCEMCSTLRMVVVMILWSLLRYPLLPAC